MRKVVCAMAARAASSRAAAAMPARPSLFMRLHSRAATRARRASVLQPWHRTPGIDAAGSAKIPVLRRDAGGTEETMSRHRWQAVACASSAGASSGRVRLQTSWACAQRGCRWQPGGGSSGLGGSPGRMRRVARAVRRRHRHGRQQGLRVGMARLGEDLRRTAALSTMRPRYMTATRVAMCFTTARSWLMKT